MDLLVRQSNDIIIGLGNVSFSKAMMALLQI